MKASSAHVTKNNASCLKFIYPMESTVGIISRAASVLDNVCAASSLQIAHEALKGLVYSCG